MRSLTRLFCFVPLIFGALGAPFDFNSFNPRYESPRSGYRSSGQQAVDEFIRSVNKVPVTKFSSSVNKNQYSSNTFTTSPATSNNNKQVNINIINLNKGDIISQTRTLANAVKTTLRELNADPRSHVIVNRIINDHNKICIRNLDEAIDDIEQATRLVEAAGADIKNLIRKVESFVNLRNPSSVAREVADILRILEPLVKNIAPEKPVICTATHDQTVGSLRNLALLVDELAYTKDLDLSDEGRGQLKQSANVIIAITSFISQLRIRFIMFQQVCTEDKQYNLQAITAIGDLMVDMADMFGSLGGIQQGEKIRQGKVFVEQISVSK